MSPAVHYNKMYVNVKTKHKCIIYFRKRGGQNNAKSKNEKNETGISIAADDCAAP